MVKLWVAAVIGAVIGCITMAVGYWIGLGDAEESLKECRALLILVEQKRALIEKIINEANDELKG